MNFKFVQVDFADQVRLASGDSFTEDYEHHSRTEICCHQLINGLGVPPNDAESFRKQKRSQKPNPLDRMQKLGGRQAAVECRLLVGVQTVLQLLLHESMPLHRVGNDAGEKEHDDEKQNDGAQIVEAMRSVLIFSAHVADEQNLRQSALDLVMDGAGYAVRARLDLADLEAQQAPARLDVDQEAAVALGVLQGGPVLLGGLHTDVVVLDVLQADVCRVSTVRFGRRDKLKTFH